MRGGPIILLIIFYPLMKKMVLAEVRWWWRYIAILLISVGLPFGVLGLDWYISGEKPDREGCFKMLLCSIVIFLGLNVVFHIAKKFEEY